MNFKFSKIAFLLLFLGSTVFFGCNDMIQEKTTKGLEVQLITPRLGTDTNSMARSGGNVDVSLMLTWQVKAWLTDESPISTGTTVGEDGIALDDDDDDDDSIETSANAKKIIQTITKDVESGKATTLSFDPVEPGTAVKVHVELVLKESGEKSYEGASDVFTVLPEGNSVAIQLKEVSEDETDTEGEGDNTGGTTPSQPPATATITNQAQLQDAISKASAGDTITITQDIVIADTILINNAIVIQGSGSGKLLRSKSGTVTGPMFEVAASGSLTLKSITLDGQYDGDVVGGENNPFIINHGTTKLNGATLTDIFMYQGSAYNGITLNSGSIYSSNDLTIEDSAIENITMNASDATSIFIASGSVNISNSTIRIPVHTNGAKYNVLTLGSDTDALNRINYNINGKTTGMSRVTQTEITPTNPVP